VPVGREGMYVSACLCPRYHASQIAGVCARQIGLFVVVLGDVNLKTGDVKSD
jgi:hypothetical protein